MLKEDKVIWLFGAPRSGTSWLGQIFNSSPEINYKLQPLFSYAFKDRIGLHTDRKGIIDFLEEVSVSDDDFVNGRAEITAGYPVFDKAVETPFLVLKHVRYHHLVEHILETLPETKMVGLIRNPLAVISSWIKAPREFDPQWDPLKEWYEGALKNQGRPEEFYGYRKWVEVVKLYERLQATYPQRFYLLRYDHLITDTLEEVKKMFSFCGIPFSSQTKDFLIERNRPGGDAYSVFNSKQADMGWKKHLDTRIAEEIIRLTREQGLNEYLNL